MTGIPGLVATLIVLIVFLVLFRILRNRYECELEQREQIAQDASTAKSAFLASMSHEIRTPMNGVIGLTDVMLEEDVSEKHRAYLNILKSSGETLLSIINDIFDFSKIEAGKLTLDKQLFSIRQVVADTEAFVG